MKAFLESDIATQFHIETPDELISLYDTEMTKATKNGSHISTPKLVTDLILAFRETYRQRGKNTMGEMVKTIFKSFFAANDRQLNSRNLKITKVSKTQRHLKRLIPTKNDVYTLVEHAFSQRDKSAILFLWQSGLRNSTMRNLTVGDVKEGLVRNEIPLKIDITPQIDKTNLREPYYTFIDLEAIESLRNYLESRGGVTTLPDDEPLFLSNQKGVMNPLSEIGLNRLIKRAAKNASYEPKRIHAHCFRTSFYNQLIGKTDDTVREFLFGHSLPGSRQAYFDPKRVEAVQQEYLKGEWSRGERTRVETLKKEVEEEKKKRLELEKYILNREKELEPYLKILETFATLVDTAEAMDLGGSVIKDERDNKNIKPKLTHNTRTYKERNNNHNTHNNNNHKIISENELVHFLDEGWEIKTTLNSGKIVIQKLQEAQ
jgi:site-specific recombinase XerC